MRRPPLPPAASARPLRPGAPSPRRRPLHPVPRPRRLLSTDIADQLIRAGRGQACHWRRCTAGEAGFPATTTEPSELERRVFRGGRGAPPCIRKRRAIARLGHRRRRGGHLGCGPARKRNKAFAAIFGAGGSSFSQRVACAGSRLSSFSRSHTVKNTCSLTF